MGIELFYQFDGYHRLIKNLEEFITFYTAPYGKVDLFGSIKYNIPFLNSTGFKNVYVELKRIEATTSESNQSIFKNLNIELRHKILNLISKIPTGQQAREKFLTNYEIYLNHCESQYDLFVKDEDSWRILYESLYDDEIDDVVSVKKRDCYNRWIESKKPIHHIQMMESSLNRICLYFKSERKYVNSNSSFGRYNHIRLKTSINFHKLAESLSSEEWFHSEQIRTFHTLFIGSKSYEPLYWLGGLSELNKFIVALYTFGMKGQTTPGIDWKSISSFILVKNEFPNSNNLKGAFTPKTSNLLELKPFAAIVKECQN